VLPALPDGALHACRCAPVILGALSCWSMGRGSEHVPAWAGPVVQAEPLCAGHACVNVSVHVCSGSRQVAVCLVGNSHHLLVLFICWLLDLNLAGHVSSRNKSITVINEAIILLPRSHYQDCCIKCSPTPAIPCTFHACLSCSCVRKLVYTRTCTWPLIAKIKSKAARICTLASSWWVTATPLLVYSTTRFSDFAPRKLAIGVPSQPVAVACETSQLFSSLLIYTFLPSSGNFAANVP
jgi:hypothetical protein